MKRLALALLLLASWPVHAQSPVTVTGPITPGNCAAFNSNTVIKDGGPCNGGGTLGTMAFQNANSVAITGGTITGLGLPVVSSDAANKQYVDNSIIGLIVHSQALLATTVALPANTYNNGSSGVGATLTGNSNGALTVDGTLTATSNRIVVKNEAAPANNGIYTVTTVGDGSNPYVLTRATDANTPGVSNPLEIGFGTYVFVTSGTANSSTGWSVTSTVTTIGTSAINWAQFSVSGGAGGNPGGSNGQLQYNNTGAFGGIANGTNGQVLIGNSGNPPSFSSAIPLNVVWFGADPTGVADSTTAINNAFTAAVGSTSNSRGARSVYFPCGTYSVTGVTLPGSATAFPGVNIYGDGVCSNIHMAAGHTTGNVLTIGSGTLNDTGDIVVRDMQISSAAQQTAGAYIFGKGLGRPQFSNIYLEDGHAFNGIALDGIDFAKITHALIFTPSHDGILAYDGFDCGFTPITKTTNGSTAPGNAVLHMANTSGLSTGMQVYDISLGPNANMSGTIQSIVVNTSVTLTVASGLFTIGNGDTLLFGASCGGVGMIIDGETTILNTGSVGIHASGGIGGWYVRSAHVYGSTTAAMALDTNASSGLYNREFFLDPGTDFDSNAGSSFQAAPNSFSSLICTGCWMSASGATFGVNIAAQHAQLNPVETGAIIKFTGCKIGTSAGVGLNWLDQGTLLIDGCDLSYNYTVNGAGLSINGTSNVGTVIVSNNMIRSNASRPVSVGTAPQYMTFIGNNWTNNPFGPFGITPSATVVCTGNIGGSGGC